MFDFHPEPVLDQPPAQAATSTTPRPAPGKITRTLAMQIDRRGASLATTSAEAIAAAVVGALRGGGAALPAPLRTALERATGQPLGAVRVHVDAAATATLGAEAFTVGDDVVFAPGRWQPDSAAGRHLIAHEIAHVVQQRGRAATALTVSEAGDPHEREADAFADGFAADPFALHLPTPVVGTATPAVRLQRRPGAEPATVAEALAAFRTQPAQFVAWLGAHAALRPTAEAAILASVARDSTDGRVATALADADPGFRARVEAAARPRFQPRADAAALAVMAVWRNYLAAASAFAGEAFAIAALVTIRRGDPRATMLTQIRDANHVTLERLRGERAGLMTTADGLLDAMVGAGATPRGDDPLGWVNEQPLTTIAVSVDRIVGNARHDRQDLPTLTAAVEPSARVDAAAHAMQTRRDAAALRDRRRATLEAERQTLRQRPRRTPAEATRLRAIARELSGLRGERTAAVDGELARHPDVRARTEYLGASGTAQADTRAALQAVRARGDAAITEPTMAGLTQAELDDVNARRVRAIETGFAGFSLEARIDQLVRRRERLVVDGGHRRSGIERPASIGTYDRHGYGQFDEMGTGGSPVHVEAPGQLDLRSVVGGSPALFRRIGSTLQHQPNQAFDHGHAGDDSVMAKLRYGMVGRGNRDADVEAFIRAREVDRRHAINAGRVANAADGDAVPDQPATGAPFTAFVAALRAAVAEERRRAAAAAPTPSPAPRAPGRDRGHRDRPLSSAAGVARAIGTRRDGDALEAHGRALNVAIYELMDHLWFGEGLRGGTGGLTSSAVHEYVETGGAGRHVWIRVSYIHMRARTGRGGAVAAHDPTGGASPGGEVVGELGGTGNATTGGGEHVHQAIGVYLHRPGPTDEPRDYLQPHDFYGMLRRRDSGAGAAP